MNMKGPSCGLPCPTCEITAIKPETQCQGPAQVAAQGNAAPLTTPETKVRRFRHDFTVGDDGTLAPQLTLRTKLSVQENAYKVDNEQQLRAQQREQDPNRARKLKTHEKGVAGLSILLALHSFCMITGCVTDIMHLMLNILQRFGDLFFDKKYKVRCLRRFVIGRRRSFTEFAFVFDRHESSPSTTSLMRSTLILSSWLYQV
jgi:hypothetical protein